MPKRGEGQPRIDPALSWRADLLGLVGYVAEAAEMGDEELSRRRLALLVRHWRRRPADPPTSAKRRR